ncbi:Protein NRT1/ PTR FAMILY 5.10 [Mucuna pruriens]|uniref:Protein NRT1/ PTR FAMILY 5.10 n=1 Tax=Mucuna pruriens TaxID=157652 RepID=A0A371ERN4_MUCPR|nr:Protein NRT1/ PTR FAMILY 5.10 [Mucuna pruriens]
METVHVDTAVDYKGEVAIRSKSGSWRSAAYIIGVEVAERIAYYGIQSNLISYLTGPLQQTTATAAENVNVWSGTASLLPLFGAFLADSLLGRYRTIILASFIYILGLGLLTLSAMLPSLTNSECQVDKSCSPQLQVIMFFVSLYLVALGQGGHKPCVQAFGADQFDEQHPKEYKDRSSFFNWWYFTMCAGCMAALWILNYIQDNLSWVLGFGIPCVAMIIALLVFLLGTTTYRFNIQQVDKSPFLRIGRVFVAAIKNRRTTLSTTAVKAEHDGILPHQTSEQFMFLNKALLAREDSIEEESCSPSEVEEAKAVLRLVPIWATCLVYGIVFAQIPTFFTKQGITMEKTLFAGFDIPAASLQSLITLGIVLFSPIYDRIFVPLARSVTGKPSGITMLQRIGTGIFISIFTLVFAALVEIKRLKTAQEYGLVEEANATIPMSVWWLIPQYFLFGISDVFTMVGLQEFFYDQIPNELRSMGLALYLSIFGVGSFISGFLISVIEQVTGKDGQDSWFANNLNKAHLDYFYWLLAGLTVMGLAFFGLGLLTLSAMLPSLTNSECQVGKSCSPQLQVILFFVSLYLMALGQGGHKPCVQAFGADQFDEQHAKEYKDRSSFFNLWYFTMCAGCLATLSILNYIQDNLSWVLGFGIPCVVMIIALLGTMTYRFNIQQGHKSPFLRIGRVFVAAIRNWSTAVHDGTLPHQTLLVPEKSIEEESRSLSEVEEAKAVLRLVPI